MTPEQKAAFEHSLIRVPENTFPAHEAGVERAIIQQDFLSGAQWQRENAEWISIEDEKPIVLAIDVLVHEDIIKIIWVTDGEKVGFSTVSDHDTWYYHAKDAGITHWADIKIPTPPKTKEDGK